MERDRRHANAFHMVADALKEDFHHHWAILQGRLERPDLPVRIDQMPQLNLSLALLRVSDQLLADALGPIQASLNEVQTAPSATEAKAAWGRVLKALPDFQHRFGALSHRGQSFVDLYGDPDWWNF